MPFKSKAQQRYFYAAEDKGKIPKGTSKKWQKETKKKLPERVKKSDVVGAGFIAGIKQASNMSEMMANNLMALYSPFMPSNESSNNVMQDFLQNNSMMAKVKRIKEDPKILPEEKNMLIRAIMFGHSQGRQPQQDMAGAKAGYVAGAAGGAMLAYLTRSNPLLAILLAGGSTLLGGAMGKELARSEFAPANQGEIRYNEWKGF